MPASKNMVKAHAVPGPGRLCVSGCDSPASLRIRSSSDPPFAAKAGCGIGARRDSNAASARA
jgi:hypothetical protein